MTYHPKPGSPLTRCEKECLALRSEGMCSRDAAKVLGVSKRTVDFHSANAFAKLGVKNILQALNALHRNDKALHRNDVTQRSEGENSSC